MLALFDRIAAVSKLDVGRESPQLEPVDLSFLLPEVEMNISLQAANQKRTSHCRLPFRRTGNLHRCKVATEHFDQPNTRCYSTYQNAETNRANKRTICCNYD